MVSVPSTFYCKLKSTTGQLNRFIIKRVYTVSTEMAIIIMAIIILASVALLITTCILGYFVMKICLAVIKAGEKAIGIVQAPERNTGEQRDQRVEQRASNTSREVRGINSIEMPSARTLRNAYERRVSNSC